MANFNLHIKQDRQKDIFKLNQNQSMLPIPGILQNHTNQNTHEQILDISNDSDSEFNDKKSQNEKMKPLLKKDFLKKQQSDINFGASDNQYLNNNPFFQNNDSGLFIRRPR